MAEILIQRRRQRNVWPWLLGLLALALLPVPFLAADDDDRREPGRTVAPRDTAPPADTTAMLDSAAVPGVVAPGGGASGSGGRSIAAAQAGAEPTGSARAGNERQTATAAGTVAPTAAGTVATAPGTAPPPRGGAAPSATPQSFERFIVVTTPPSGDREYRDFTSTGLRLLADELRALGATSLGLRAIRAYADSLRITSGRAGAHPDYARAAFLAAIRELDLLRGRHRVAVDTGALRAAAWSIRTDERLVAQRARVHTFFAIAHDALRAVSGAPGLRRRAR